MILLSGIGPALVYGMNNEQQKNIGLLILFKQKVLTELLSGGIYYTQYRFNSISNYIDFEQYCLERVNKMNLDDLIDFAQKNKLI